MKLVPKVVTALLCVTCGFVAPYATLEMGRLEQSLIRDTESGVTLLLASTLPSLAQAVSKNDQELVKKSLRLLMEHGQALQLIVFDVAGRPLSSFANSREPSESGNAASVSALEKLKAQLQLGHALTSHFEIPLQQVAPLERMGNHRDRLVASLWDHDARTGTPVFVGHVVMDFSTSQATARIRMTQVRIVFFASLLVVGILVVSFAFLRLFILTPLARLKAASDEIIHGKFPRVPEMRAHDEMAILTHHFNEMVKSMERDMENVKILKEEMLGISSVMTLAGLYKRVPEAFFRIVQEDCEPKLYFSHVILLNSNLSPGFYCVDETDVVTKESRIAQIPEAAPDELIFEVLHPKEPLVLGFVALRKPKLWDGRTQATLQAMIVSLAGALCNVHFVSQQRLQDKRMADLAITSFVQRSLVPTQDLHKFSCYEIASHFRPAAECGGDWWSYYPLNDGRLVLLLGDVTGHGISSAFLTAVVKGYCDAAYQFGKPSLVEIMRELNVIVKSCSDGKLVMSLFGMMIDPERQEMEFANAGHNFPFFVNAALEQKESPRRVFRLMQSGPLLGFDKNYSDPNFEDDGIGFHSSVRSLQKDDVVVVFSDGLVECVNRLEQHYTERRLRKMIDIHVATNVSLVDARDAILKDHDEFCEGVRPADDITFFMVRLR